jgi:hypothetical protein
MQIRVQIILHLTYTPVLMKNGGNLRHDIARMVKPTLKMPDEPPANPSATQEAIWKRQIDEYVIQGMMIEENLKTA